MSRIFFMTNFIVGLSFYRCHLLSSEIDNPSVEQTSSGLLKVLNVKKIYL